LQGFEFALTLSLQIFIPQILLSGLKTLIQLTFAEPTIKALKALGFPDFIESDIAHTSLSPQIDE
jgi:hypothetical protein